MKQYIHYTHKGCQGVQKSQTYFLQFTKARYKCIKIK